MGSEKKKSGLWRGEFRKRFISLLLRYFLSFKSFITRITSQFKNRKVKKQTVIQVSVVFLLVITTVLLYFKLSKREQRFKRPSFSFFSKSLSEGISQYRLENFDRARLILEGILKNSTNRDERAISAVYLGNIEYYRGNYERALIYYSDSFESKDIKYYGYYNSAVVYANLGFYDKALKYAEKSANDTRLSVRSSLLIGNIYYVQGKYSKAIEYFQRHPENSIFMYNYAVTLEKLGKLDESASLLIKIASQENTDSVVRGLCYFKAGLIYSKGKPKKASGCLKKSVSFFSQNDQLVFNTSVEIAKAGNFKESSLVLDMFNPENLDVDKRLFISYVYFKADRSVDALRILSSIEKEKLTVPELRMYYLLLGGIMEAKGDLKKAEEYYKQSIKIEKTPESILRLINIYEKMKNIEKAIELCEEIDIEKETYIPLLLKAADVSFKYKGSYGRETGQNFIDRIEKLSRMRDDILINIAHILEKNGFYDNALKILYRVLDRENNNWQARFYIAYIFFNNGNRARAMNVLKKIIDECPDSDIYYDAMILTAELKEDDRGDSIYTKLIKDFPYRYEAFYNLARSYISRGMYEEALGILDDFLDNNASVDKMVLAFLYTLKGIALYNVGKESDAYLIFKKASEMDRNLEYPSVNLKIMGGK